MSYGVLPQGFNRKPLPTILAEIESAMIAVFGPEVVQTSQSPLGQINGLMADLISQEWEMLQDTYQSYDPDQAEGSRLEILGRLRLLERAVDETDLSLRQAITNSGRARIDLQDLSRALLSLSGVTYAQVFVNDTATTDSNGVAGHSVAVAVLGGDTDEIARTMRLYVVPGIGTYGNVRTDVSIEGFCRTIWLIRPTVVPLWLHITVETSADKNGCPPASPTALAVALVAELSGDYRLLNGQDVDLHSIRVPLAIRHPNVEVISATASLVDSGYAALPKTIGFFEIAEFSVARTLITVI